jgi:hypothetical protein
LLVINPPKPTQGLDALSPADADEELQWWDCEYFLRATALCLIFFFFNSVEHWSQSWQTLMGIFCKFFLSNTPHLLLLLLHP